MILALLALPAAHNLYYSGRLSVLPSRDHHESTLPMPPSRWLRVFDDNEPKKQALVHLGAVTYTNHHRYRSSTAPTVASHVVFLVACRGLQAAWVLAAILAVLETVGGPAGPTHYVGYGDVHKLLLILPALYLAVHLFYQVRDYHPRFIVIGYLAMGAVAMLAVRAAAVRQAGSMRGRGVDATISG